jgi:hypothetical protein
MMTFLSFSAHAEGGKAMLHPDYPIVEGTYQMTEDWSVSLPGKFNRRVEDDSLVIWRPGLTLWTSVWANDHNDSLEGRLSRIVGDASPEAFDKLIEKEEGLVRYSYRLAEESDDEREAAFYCFAIGRDGHVQMSIYFDNPEDISVAQDVWRSLSELPQ